MAKFIHLRLKFEIGIYYSCIILSTVKFHEMSEKVNIQDNNKLMKSVEECCCSSRLSTALHVHTLAEPILFA